MLIVPESFSGGRVTIAEPTFINPALLTKFDGDPNVTIGPEPVRFRTPSARLFSVPVLIMRLPERLMMPELFSVRDRPREPNGMLTTAPCATVVTPLPLIVPLFQFRPLLI